jgi:membrane protease subunit (stomatin/prohibitin family)
MALLDRIKFDPASDDWFVWKFPSDNIKMGSHLVVNEAQEAVLFRGGQAFDVFGPGTYALATSNIPLLSSLVNAPFGGNSPLPAEVWFVSKHVKRNLKWGTKSPIPLIDPLLGYPVRIRAFGRYGIAVNDCRLILPRLVAALPNLTTERILDYFASEIVQRLSELISKHLVEKHTSVFEINAHLNGISQDTREALHTVFSTYGIDVASFNIENIGIPDEDLTAIQVVLGKKMEVEQLGKTAVSKSYSTVRALDALDKAAGNQGSGGALLAGGIGLGVGAGIGNKVGGILSEALDVTGRAPIVAQASTPTLEERLGQLKSLLDKKLISEQEFIDQRNRILHSL